MEKKYRLTEETIELYGSTLHRIEALKDFNDVKKGELGGWIEKEENLSHDGDCWVRGETVVCGDAVVRGDAQVYDHAQVRDHAVVCDNALVYGNAHVTYHAQVSGHAVVGDYAVIFNYAQVRDNAVVADHAVVCGYAVIFDHANVFGDAVVCDKAKVSGNAVVYGSAEVRGDAVIKDNSDFLLFKNFWSSGRFFTWTKSNDKWSVGCFYGTGDELIEKAYADDKVKGEMYKSYVEFVKSVMRKYEFLK